MRSCSDWTSKVVSYRNSTSNHNYTGEASKAYLVVSYRNSTSNHNTQAQWSTADTLYLIEILHQTTTLLSLPLPGALLYLIEILHQTTTRPLLMFLLLPLYLIEILHQTTTMHYSPMFLRELYLIEILHQTTTSKSITGSLSSCILSKFYIKPQPGYYLADIRKVVSYRNSTSNHNWWRCRVSRRRVVSYRNSTSNHNKDHRQELREPLYLIEILHQTTTSPPILWSVWCCILSKFYIKPQPVSGEDRFY